MNLGNLLGGGGLAGLLGGGLWGGGQQTQPDTTGIYGFGQDPFGFEQPQSLAGLFAMLNGRQNNSGGMSGQPQGSFIGGGGLI